MKEKIAIVLLACKDYESLEITLATYAKNIKENHKLFVLQNGRNNYDCERTYRVALRYQNLFPENICVVDWIKPQMPYFAIQELLNSDTLKDFEYICKVDDDVFSLHEDWLEKLFKCYKKSKEKYGEKLAYVTPLINNNFWGFGEVLKVFNLENEFFEKIARDHIVGDNIDPIEVKRKVPKTEIYSGWGGTIQRNPYISRWVHLKTTLYPEKYLKLTENLGYKDVDSTKRYAINCIFFEKDFWNAVYLPNDNFDEYMILKYCRKNNMKIVADLSNPFVHLLYWVQREENRDLIPVIRETYERFLNLPFPISMCPDKNYEIENRLRVLEGQLQRLEQKNNGFEDILKEQNFLKDLAASLNSNHKILLWGASNFLRTIFLKYPLYDPNILGIVDIDSKKWGKIFNRYKVCNPESIKKFNPDTIIVSIINKKEERIKEIEEYLKTIDRKNIKII